MKRSMVLPALLLAAVAFLSVSQTAKAASLRCVGADGKTACTAGQQSALTDALATGKRMHKPVLIDIQSFSFGASGVIVCKQTGGGDCDDNHLNAVMSLTPSSKSPDAAFHLISGPREASSGMASGR